MYLERINESYNKVLNFVFFAFLIIHNPLTGAFKGLRTRSRL